MFLLLFLNIDISFLIPTVIAQIFNCVVEHVIPIGISSKKAKAEIEVHPVTTTLKNESVQYNLEL